MKPKRMKTPPLSQFVKVSEYARTREISRQYVYKLAREGVIEIKGGLVDPVKADQARKANTAAGRPVDECTYAEARRRKEIALASLRELELQLRMGELTSVDAVRERAFKIGRIVRDRMQSIPDRVAGIIAAEKDQDKIYEILTKEIHNALEALANGGLGRE